jgi:hypothetical protein
MSNNSTDFILESTIERQFEELKAAPARDPLRAASARARFLSEAASYQHTVSPRAHVRQSGWIFPIRKEKLAMNALVSLILAASLLLGGGATIAAAQDDLPTQSLYQLKLWTENATLAMNGEPQEQADLLMNMAQTRVQEMAALAEMGITPPDQVRARLEGHLRQTLMLAADMDGAELEQTLLQLRDRLREQDRIMQQSQTHAGAEIEPLLTRTRQMLQLHQRLVDQGLADPQGFRYMMKNGMQYGPDEEATPGPNQQGEPGFHHNGPTEQPTNGPGAGNGSSEGNGSPGGPNPESPQPGNGGNGSGNNEPGGNNPEKPDGGNNGGSGSGGGGGDDDGGGSGGSGGNNDGGGSGGGGGNK